ncbi:MAG TPA: hypothetical protein VJ246_03035 [Patescibacteria group bacterium]|nr:hypothetical protein [Patescibacteria group bacterium]
MSLSRREFLKLSGAALLGLPLSELLRRFAWAASREPTLSDLGIVEVFRDEKETGVIRPKNLPVITLPMTRDFRYDPKGMMKMFYLDGDLDISYKSTVILSNPKGNDFVVAPLWHVTGEQVLPVAILETGKMKGNKFETKDRFYSGQRSDNAGLAGEYMYLAGPYPNKIYNLLRSLEQILINQEITDGFRAGEECSFRHFVSLMEKTSLFRLGLTLSGEEIGGGACAGASIFAKAAIRTGNAEILEMWGHRPANRTYWASPLDPSITALNSDASVDAEHDFRVRFKKNYYLQIGAKVLTTADYATTSKMDLVPGGDHIVFSLGFTEQKPDNAKQLAKIQQVLSTYGSYRDTHLQVVGKEIALGGVSVAQMKSSDPNIFQELAKKTFLEHNTRLFSEELKSRTDLQEINLLSGIINDYSNRYPLSKGKGPGVGTHLKNSDWYRWKSTVLNKADLATLDGVFNFLDRFTYYGGVDQVIQCVGWVALLAKLGYPNSPKYIAGINFTGPAELIPDQIKRLADGNQLKTTNNSGLLVHGGDLSIDDVQEGDLFFEYNTKVGHVGAVIAKKIVNSQTCLLISEANRGSDGKIIMRQVSNQTELKGILGPWPNKIILVHK